MNQSVRALVGLALLFAVYLVYQQWQILRMRRQISEQIESLGHVQSLTAEVYKLAALDHVTPIAVPANSASPRKYLDPCDTAARSLCS